MNKYIYSVLSVLIFLLSQLIVGGIVMLYVICAKTMVDQKVPSFDDDLNPLLRPTTMSLATIVSGLIAVFIVGRMMHINYRSSFTPRTKSWRLAGIAIVAAFFGVVATNIMSELLNLPDYMEDEFIIMSQTFLGLVTISIVAPVVEEYILREAVMGYLLRHNANKWVAILFSAFLFGAMHLNPAQMPFAFIIGIIFGVIYYKTGNILVTTGLHIANNTLSCVMMAIMGQEASNVHLADKIGVAGAVCVMIASSVISVIGLYHFWKKYPTAPYDEDAVVEYYEGRDV